MIKTAKAFYGTRFSSNMTRTPEGFLICHNVPIGRTGWQQYLGQELNLDDVYDKTINVYRSPEEVFSPATIASFEGKPVCDEHPQQDVRPDNFSMYTRGTVTNVRPGEGSESDCLIADLIVYDPTLISEIEHGKREVSCGYECNYEPLEEDGKYQQTHIRGNHVAVVIAGRAGARVAIKDQKPTERRKSMKVDRNTLWGRMLSAFAKDADPEELAEASRMAAGNMEDYQQGINPFEKQYNQHSPHGGQHAEHGISRGAKHAEENKDHHDSLSAPPATPPKTADSPEGNGIMTSTECCQACAVCDPSCCATCPCTCCAGCSCDTCAEAATCTKKASVKAAGEAKPEAALDALLAQMENPYTTQPQIKDDESITIPAEDDSAYPAPELPASMWPVNPIPGHDRNSIMNAIKAIRPVIAQIKDPGERKRASDALAKTFKDQLTATVPSQQQNGYAAILKAQQATAAKARDTRKSNEDLTQLGKEFAKKFNPHYNKGV